MPARRRLPAAACNANFFVTSYQNDQIYEALGQVANEKGYKNVYALVPNYQAGKDALAGFKRTYKGKLVEESLLPLNTTDFQPEVSKIWLIEGRCAVHLHAGRPRHQPAQDHAAGRLKDKLPVLSAFTADEATLPVLQDAALGVFGALTWAPNMDNPQNKKFVAEYEKAYNAVPASYAMQAYDAAMLIDSAVRATKGNLSDSKAISAAMQQGRLQVAARAVQVQRQRLSDRGFLSDQGRQARRRQIPDRDRARRSSPTTPIRYAKDCKLK